MTWQEAATEHKSQHTNNLFYSLTPELSIAIIIAMNQFADIDRCRGYYEFGVFKGYSLWFAQQYAHVLGKQWSCYGFDSFEGMPENDVHPNWTKGNYAADILEVVSHIAYHGGDLMSLRLFKGWFSPEYFAALQKDGMTNFLPADLVVIDSDLEESCEAVLPFISQYFVPGTVILFDDWYAYDGNQDRGEQGAWCRFARDKQIDFALTFQFGKYGRAVKIAEGN